MGKALTEPSVQREPCPAASETESAVPALGLQAALAEPSRALGKPWLFRKEEREGGCPGAQGGAGVSAAAGLRAGSWLLGTALSQLSCLALLSVLSCAGQLVASWQFVCAPGSLVWRDEGCRLLLPPHLLHVWPCCRCSLGVPRGSRSAFPADWGWGGCQYQALFVGSAMWLVLAEGW